jgi:hypothetical protein
MTEKKDFGFINPTPKWMRNNIQKAFKHPLSELPEPMSNLMKEEDLKDLKRLDQLPEPMQDIIASYTNMFLEPDMKKKYLEDQKRFIELVDQLRAEGLDSDQITLTLKLIGLNKERTE